MSAQIQARKNEPRPPKKKKQSVPKENAIGGNSPSSENQPSAETMFKDLINQIQNRVSNIKFAKDDFKTYSEVQC